MQTRLQLTPPISPEEFRAMIERIINTLDPELPSIVIAPGPVGAIGEPSGAYLEREKPDFVKADDKGWG